MKCISIDIDGTLLSQQEHIPEENLAAIRKAKEQGYTVILNSGRTYEEIHRLKGIPELELPYICMNGTQIYSAEHELLVEHTIEPDLLRFLLHFLKKFRTYVEIYTNKGIFKDFRYLDGKSPFEKETIQIDFDKLIEDPSYKIYKLMLFPQPEYIPLMKEGLSSFNGINHSSAFDYLFEITSPAADKGQGVLSYAKETNVELEMIISLGDGGNDIPLFDISTLSIAMRNSQQEVKDKAYIVTKPNTEFGVAYALNEYVLTE